MLNLQRVLFYTGIDLHDIMQIYCLAHKYFVFIAFLLVDYNIWYCEEVLIGVPPPQSSTIYIYQKSEFLKLIIIRIICEFQLMCAVHTLPYLSHKMVKIMFPLEYLLKFSCTNYISNV